MRWALAAPIAEEPEPARIAALRAAETISRPLGSAAFLHPLAALTGRDPRPGKRGRRPRAAGQALAEGASRPIDRLPLRRVKILGASRVLCYICSLSERLSMTASAEAVPQCHAAVRGHEKVGSSEILVTPKPSSPRAERGVARRPA